MNTINLITTALTPGSPMNRNDHVFRSIISLAAFAGVGEEEVLELLNGDMANDVTIKPSKDQTKGLLAALTKHIPANVEADEAAEPVKILGGNAVQIPEGHPGNVPLEEGEVDDALKAGLAAVAEAAVELGGEDQVVEILEEALDADAENPPPIHPVENWLDGK